MTESMMKRACRALMDARSTGGFYFTKVYVVMDEMTFSKKVADRMLVDAKWVRCAQLRKLNPTRYALLLPKDITSIDVEMITFEQAYKKVHNTKTVPLEEIGCALHEMDEIHVSCEGQLYIPKRQRADYERALAAVEKAKKKEEEELEKVRAENKARREASKKIAEEKKAKNSEQVTGNSEQVTTNN